MCSYSFHSSGKVYSYIICWLSMHCFLALHHPNHCIIQIIASSKSLHHPSIASSKSLHHPSIDHPNHPPPTNEKHSHHKVLGWFHDLHKASCFSVKAHWREFLTDYSYYILMCCFNCWSAHFFNYKALPFVMKGTMCSPLLGFESCKKVHWFSHKQSGIWLVWTHKTNSYQSLGTALINKLCNNISLKKKKNSVLQEYKNSNEILVFQNTQYCFTAL